MSGESLLSMDPNILLSMVNLKLRDYYGSLEDYCEDLGINKALLEENLEKIGYSYNREINQFR